MQLDVLRAFLVALEEGSLSRAATRLHLGQSSLTRQIAGLEHEIGAQLLERSARGIAPTAAGQSLAEGLRAPLQAIATTLARSRSVGRGERTELKIGYLQSVARSYLNPALAALRAAHPALRVKLTDMCAGSQMRALREGTIDVGLIGHEGRMLAREFYTRKVCSVPVVAALPDDHPLAARAVIRLADLRGEMFVGADEHEAPGYNRWVAQLCRRAGYRPRFAQDSDGTAHKLALVVSERAIALLPEFAREQPAASVVMRNVADAEATWDFIVVWQRGRMAPAVRAFLAALPSVRAERLAVLKSA